MTGYSREIMDFVATRHLRRSDLTPNEDNSFEIKDNGKHSGQLLLLGQKQVESLLTDILP